MSVSTLREQWLSSGIPQKGLELLNQIMDFERRVMPSPLASREGNYEEFELKFKVDNCIFDLLASIGAERKIISHEMSTIWDLPDNTFHCQNARLRLRRITSLQNPTAVLLSVKKPKSTSIGSREFEAELRLDGKEAENIFLSFENSGLVQVSSYERIRQTYAVSKVFAKVDVDLLPDIGRYIEIEGREASVLELAALMGFSPQAAESRAYDTLHADWCLSLAQPERDYICFKENWKLLLEAESLLSESLNS